MTAFPDGEWSFLLVGDQWPADEDLRVLQHAKASREALKNGYYNFADMLQSAQISSLAEQGGRTVDDLRLAFQRGEACSRRIGERNSVKAGAYSSAIDSTVSVQQTLSALAEEGNSEIKAIQNSMAAGATRVAQILAMVQKYRALANATSAKYGANILDAIQRILDTNGTIQSAREFARTEGADVGLMFGQPFSRQYLESEVRRVLNEPDVPTGIPGNASARSALQAPIQSVAGQQGNELPANLNTGPERLSGGHAPQYNDGTVLPTNLRTQPIFAPAQGHVSTPTSPTAITPTRAPSVPLTPPPALTTHTAGPLPSAPTTPSAGPSVATTPHASALPTIPSLTSAELVQSFSKGMESGAPFAAAHAVPSLPMTSSEPQISHSAPSIPAAQVNSPVHVPVVDAPPPAHHATVSEMPTATPIVAAAQPLSSSVAPTQVGTLPTYGSDLRPAVTTTITSPSSPSPPPLSATPSSAPVTPSSGQSPTSQPAVVRQSAPTGPPQPSSALGTQAVVAAATGTTVGAASAGATAKARLERLVAAVARQQPRLAWAAGDRADHTTVLTTDLASGWIPPGIELPSAVTLPLPKRSRASLEALLGDVTITASYAPIHHLPDDSDPPPTSQRPRQAPDIADLGWELSQATQWRDGLPRLAHTLAKAASAGTGVLDSEISLLREHLAAISDQVLDSYPNSVNSHDVGNWQLLAAIDALVSGDKIAANYHLAWFLVCKPTATTVTLK